MKENDWKSRLGVVYSTNPNFQYETAPEAEAETLPPAKQRLIVAIDRRNRGGKQVTLVTGFVGKADDLKELGKALKTKCGVGGTAKDGEITIQGDLRDKVVALLKEMGYNAKRGNVAAAGEGLSLAASILVAVSVLLFLLALRSFLNVLPYLSDSILRARGSAALENSVRVSRDRNLVAAVFLVPAILLIYRYRLFDIAWFDTLTPDMRIAAVAGVFLVFLFVRFLLYRWFRPRRRYDDYQMAYRAGYTFFILLMILALLTVGVCYVLHLSDLTVKTILLVETGVMYLLYLFRRGQILSMSCNSLTTFLYLCALELLPTALLVIPAVIL